MKRKAALVIYALVVTSAPLLFGAVDRQIQIALTLLLGIGLLFVQPAAPRLSPWMKRLLAALLVVVVAKEFAPSAWFGQTRWHKILTQSYELAFPWTHNPEPGCALDALLVITVGIVWFLWVRTLAADNANRPTLIWSLLVSAALFAIVCLAVRPGASASMIYGIRFTPGWTGYGPFPNRNHTACFLAMGALLGCGCLARAAVRRLQLQIVVSFISLLLIFVALLESKSRGGLVAFAIGLGLFGLLTLFKLRSRVAFASAAAGALAFALLFLAFGSQVASRFHSGDDAGIPSNVRWNVWADAVAMWKDAPLFGHGLDSFGQIFPMYQTLKLENQIVLHPESSWLQWLAELGAVPVLLVAGIFAVFVAKNLRQAFAHQRGFFLRASGFGALTVLGSHAIWDVPAHRWATVGYALAILAIICPLRPGIAPLVFKRKSALVPLGIAAFWALPFFTGFPAWSPSFLTKILSLPEGLASAPELENELRFFPLNPSLHQSLGMKLLADYKEAPTAWLHFRIADRLTPSAWPLPAAQAVASRPFSAGMALHFWTVAIERAGHRAEDVFNMACENTSRLAVAAPFWSSYVENNPQLLLSYAQRAPEAEERYYFQLWWKTRAFDPQLMEFEIRNFYDEVARVGSLANLYEWMTHHPDREEDDWKTWAALLHHWNDDATAWKILSRRIREPEYPPAAFPTKPEVLEAEWLGNPTDVLNAQALAQAYAAGGRGDKSREIILAVAAQEHAPVWFLHKAAYLQAADGRYASAVAALLRDR